MAILSQGSQGEATQNNPTVPKQQRVLLTPKSRCEDVGAAVHNKMENDVSSAEARSEKKTGDKLWLTLGWRKTTDGADYRLESELVKCSVFF